MAVSCFVGGLFFQALYFPNVCSEVSRHRTFILSDTSYIYCSKLCLTIICTYVIKVCHCYLGDI